MRLHSEMINKESKIFVAGHNGMVGSAILRSLSRNGYSNIITEKRPIHKDRSSRWICNQGVDLLNQKQVEEFLFYNKPDVVVNCAAKVGGIHANNEYRADFIYENLQIQNNLIHLSYKNNVKKFLFLGSSCIYPKFADQPIKEEYLLTSPLEYTNEPYSIAKIAGIKMCESYYKQYGCNFFGVMPTNLYGPNDNFHPKNSHVLPGLIAKFHKAKENDDPFLEVWGTGKAKREFLHVDDLADACTFIIKNVDAKNIYEQKISHLNIGSGTDISISKLANKIAETVGFSGKIKFQLDKPDGTLRKLMDSSRLRKLGWRPEISLKEGLKQTYEWYTGNLNKIRSF